MSNIKGGNIIKNIHMTYEDRLEIERGLKLNKSLTEISNIIDKDISTVRKEIVKHRVEKKQNTFNGNYNICIHFIDKTCNVKYLCNIDSCNKLCCTCKRHFCNKMCKLYSEFICEHLLHKPYACNGCQHKQGCKLTKKYYYAKDADIEYHNTLNDARKGCHLNENEINYINDNIVPLVKQGQSFDNIINSNNGITSPVCKQSLYNYTDKKYIKLCNLDLPKKVKYKKRDKVINTVDENKISALKTGRTYDKFVEYCEENSNYLIAEMDTVEGIKGGKLLLTLLLRDSNFMLAFLIDNKKALTVNNKLYELKQTLGSVLFSIIFRIILTDNGVEFTMILEIEKIENGENINLFFCDAGKSGQKGKIEKNHVELRKILPKGTSFDNLTQEDINLVLSHINSYKRKKLGWKSPMDIVIEQFGEGFIKLLNQKKINDQEIILKPELLKKK